MKITTILVSTTIGALGLSPLLHHTSSAIPSATPRPPPAAPNLKQFMQQELNSALTDVSYHLFHARQPGAEPGPELISALERLSRKSAELARHPRGQGEEGASFRIHAVQLQIAARGLTEASMGGDDTQQRLWMTHVSSVCNSCHAEYRAE